MSVESREAERRAQNSATATATELRGERVTLRDVRDDDAPYFVRWAADAEFAWYQWGRAAGRFPDEASARTFFARFVPPDGRLLVIEHLGGEAASAHAGGFAPRGRPIGFANYRDLRPKPRSAEIGIGIGEKALWGKHLGREALQLFMRHLLDDLGLHRLTLHVHAENDRAVASYKACGFEVEGVLRDAVMTDRGTYIDSIEMAYVVGRQRPSFDPVPVVLEGPQVRLEPLRMEHAEELFAAVREPGIWTYLSLTPPAGARDIATYIRSALDEQVLENHLPWLTRRRSDGRAIGTTRYAHIDRPNRSLEIGWSMLAAEARSTGANIEAKYLQLRHAFEDLGAIRVWLNTDQLNLRSQRAMEKLGAVREGEHRRDRLMPGERVRSSIFYSFVDEDWPSVRERLLKMINARTGTGAAPR